MGEIAFLPLKLNIQINIVSIDFFTHLAEVEVLKYLPSFPFWPHCSGRQRRFLILVSEINSLKNYRCVVSHGWKTWQVFLNLKLVIWSKKINK